MDERHRFRAKQAAKSKGLKKAGVANTPWWPEAWLPETRKQRAKKAKSKCPLS